jgi:hypothetical protein
MTLVMRRLLPIVLLVLLLSSNLAAKDWRGILPEYLQDPQTPEQEPICRLPQKFDSYGALRHSDEKARLDNFAIQLMKSDEMVGYILVYAGRKATEAQLRANRARDYLINVRKIDPQRVKAIDAGHREDFQVDCGFCRPMQNRRPLNP